MHKHFRKAIVIGSGLGGLSTALRLSSAGYEVTVLEKHATPGGRLNRIELDGFSFDLGPSFLSMSYELEELFRSCGITNPVELVELEPIYQVFFEGRERPYLIWKDQERLEEEFKDIEPHFYSKAERYLNRAGEIFHDTEHRIVKRNFENRLDYLLKLTRVPMKHLPYLMRSLWSEVSRTFTSEEVRIIFSLVAFFLGSTPFKTPAIYSILNYTEFRHNGYWIIRGGMYRLVEEIVRILAGRGVQIITDTEIVQPGRMNGSIDSFVDQRGRRWEADLFVVNADAALFRGKVLGRPEYTANRLDAMEWTLAPFTIYLGVRGKIDRLLHHNYFLGSDFRRYADTIFTSPHNPSRPYYYVNAPSRTDAACAPDGCENLFILCPVPDLRYKPDWSDRELLADTIIKDLSKRIGYDIAGNAMVRKILAPDDWARMFNLYRGSGLGLAHGMNQVGGFRPKNKDEHLDNLFYVGASTVPGTGLPMVIISSKLAMERIEHEYANIHLG